MRTRNRFFKYIREPVPLPLPAEAGIINEDNNGYGLTYNVSLDQRLVGSADNLADAEDLLIAAMDMARSKAKTYFVNMRGAISTIVPMMIDDVNSTYGVYYPD